jgi:hypothetical protein
MFATFIWVWQRHGGVIRRQASPNKRVVWGFRVPGLQHEGAGQFGLRAPSSGVQLHLKMYPHQSRMFSHTPVIEESGHMLPIIRWLQAALCGTGIWHHRGTACCYFIIILTILMECKHTWRVVLNVAVMWLIKRLVLLILPRTVQNTKYRELDQVPYWTSDACNTIYYIWYDALKCYSRIHGGCLISTTHLDYCVCASV